MKQILVTCPPMIGQISRYADLATKLSLQLIVPDFIQTVPESQLLKLISKVDGWIIGDDIASRKVLEVGVAGKLSAVIKWGIGIDNIDTLAISDLSIKFTNTPGVFGNEVADIAVHYLVGLARSTYVIDREVRVGNWIKPAGRSLSKCNIGVVGYGDIGRNVVKRLQAMGSHSYVIDPYSHINETELISMLSWDEDLSKLDFIVITCSLTNENRHMINAHSLSRMKDGIGIVNVARGGLIDETDLLLALNQGKVGSCALDVFEVEPVNPLNPLVQLPNVICGSHNSSNTLDAVDTVSSLSLQTIARYLEND